MTIIIIINIIVVIEHKKLYVQQDEKQHKKTTKQKTDIGVVNARVQKPHFKKRKKIFTNLKGKVFSQIQIIFLFASSDAFNSSHFCKFSSFLYQNKVPNFVPTTSWNFKENEKKESQQFFWCKKPLNTESRQYLTKQNIKI